MSARLSESVLFRLTCEGIANFLSQAERYEASMHPGCWSVLCNEPIADMNYIIAGRGAADSEHFANSCKECLSRELPFLALIFPEAGSRAERIAEDLGLVYAVDFPIMVQQEPIEPSGNEAVQVRQAQDDKDAAESARVLHGAFSMAEDSVNRALPAAQFQGPSLDVYLASVDGDTVGTVTVTHHGDTSGIWAMGTDPNRQRGGIGRRLLSSAMSAARKQGAQRFFLGATPAGFKLYESLGYEQVCAAKVWVSGETHQS